MLVKNVEHCLDVIKLGGVFSSEEGCAKTQIKADKCYNCGNESGFLSGKSELLGYIK